MIRIITLSIPIVVGQLGHLMMNVTDNLMLGRLGPTALASASIANALFTLIMVVGIGISLSVTPLTAIACGAGREKECGVVLRQGLVVNLLAGTLLAACCFALSAAIPYMNQPKETIAPAVRYLQILGLSMLPIMLFQNYRQFAEGVNFLKPAMLISLAANVVNILANWIFIFGNLGFPKMEVAGAGIATISSRIFMAAALFYVISTAPTLKRFDPTLNFRKIDPGMMKKLLAIGLPAGCQYFFEVSAFAASSIMVGWMGTLPLAAHQIALNLASISFMVALGISAAGTIQVGHAVGRKDVQATRQAGFSAVLLCICFMACAGIVFVLFRHFLPTLYVSDPGVIHLAGSLLIMVAIFQVSDGTQCTGLGILRGLTDMKIPTMITLVAYWIVGLPTAYLLGFQTGMGIYGVWFGLFLSLSISGLLLMIRFHTKSRQIRN